MKTDKSVKEFRAALRDYMCNAYNIQEFVLRPEHNAAVDKLRDEVYAQWSWNYGNSPPYTLRKTRRIEGCGKIEILLDMEKEGKIKNIAFYGDFFANRDPCELAALLTGHHPEYAELNKLLAKVDISQYFHALDTENFLALLLE